MPAVVGFIAAAIGSAAGAIGSVVGAIAGFVSAAIAPIVTVITTVVGGVIGVIAPLIAKILIPILSVVDVILGPLAAPVAGFANQIISQVVLIQGAISTGILQIKGSITSKLAPILNPVNETLGTISEYVGTVENIITDSLAPVTEMTDVIRSISTIKMTNTLLASTEDVTNAVAPITAKKHIPIAGAITSLWRETVESVTGLATITDDYYKLLKHEIDTVDNRIKEESAIAIADIENIMDLSLKDLSKEMTTKTEAMQETVSGVLTMVENVPRFQEMLIQSLKI